MLLSYRLRGDRTRDPAADATEKILYEQKKQKGVKFMSRKLTPNNLRSYSVERSIILQGDTTRQHLFLVEYHPEEEFCDRPHGHIVLWGKDAKGAISKV